MTTPPVTAPSRRRRFLAGMLCSVLVVACWTGLCLWLRTAHELPYFFELQQFGIFNLYILALLPYLLACMLAARKKTAWWSFGAVAGMLLALAAPVTIALLAASGMPAMRY